MNKKLLGVLAIGALVITGCAAKEGVKTQKEEAGNSGTANTTTEQKEGSTVKTSQNLKHDLQEARKLIDVVGISGNDLSRLKEQTNFLAWITQNRVVKSQGSNGEELFTISREDYLDVINELSAKTYTMEEALNLIKGNNFNEYEVSSDKSPLQPTENEIHYYKGDEKIVFVGITPSNNRPLEIEDEEKWLEKEDTIEINVVDAMTKTKVSTVSLKLNDKEYSGGNKKTTYYVSDIKSNI